MTMTDPKASVSEYTMIIARFRDRVKDDKIIKSSMTLFYNGGNDKRGYPIFSNSKNKLVGFVDAINGRIRVFETEKDGRLKLGQDGNPEKPILSIGIDRFISGYKNGVTAKNIEPGGGTIIGPQSKKIATILENVATAAKSAKEARNNEAKPSRPHVPRMGN